MKEPEQEYRQWYKSQHNFYLGATQFIQVENEIWVANIIGQHKIKMDESGNSPIRYEAVAEGLKKIALFAKDKSASVHMPRIGCGLAGGKWEIIEPLILSALSQNDISVTVYDFK